MDEPDYEVEKIVDSASFPLEDCRVVLKYKVRWRGFPPEEDTWEEEENLDQCPEIMREYKRRAPPEKLKVDRSIYLVDKIVDFRRDVDANGKPNGKKFYKVKWIGWEKADWEPEENLTQDLIREFHATHATPKKRGRKKKERSRSQSPELSLATPSRASPVGTRNRTPSALGDRAEEDMGGKKKRKRRASEHQAATPTTETLPTVVSRPPDSAPSLVVFSPQDVGAEPILKRRFLKRTGVTADDSLSPVKSSPRMDAVDSAAEAKTSGGEVVQQDENVVAPESQKESPTSSSPPQPTVVLETVPAQSPATAEEPSSPMAISIEDEAERRAALEEADEWDQREAEEEEASVQRLYGLCCQALDEVSKTVRAEMERQRQTPSIDWRIPIPLNDVDSETLYETTLLFQEGGQAEWKKALATEATEAANPARFDASVRLGDWRLAMGALRRWMAEQNVPRLIYNSDLGVAAAREKKKLLDLDCTDQGVRIKQFFIKLFEETTESGVTLLMKLAWGRGRTEGCGSPDPADHTHCRLLGFLAAFAPPHFIESSTRREDWTALMVAAHMGYRCQIKHLLEAGALVSSRASKGVTALRLAVDRGEEGLNGAQMLLSWGADSSFVVGGAFRPSPTLERVLLWQKMLQRTVEPWVHDLCRARGALVPVRPFLPVATKPIREFVKDDLVMEVRGDDCKKQEEEEGLEKLVFLFPFTYERVGEDLESPKLQRLKKSEERRVHLLAVLVNGIPKYSLVDGDKDQLMGWVVEARQLGSRPLNRVQVGMNPNGGAHPAVLAVQAWWCKAKKD